VIAAARPPRRAVRVREGALAAAALALTPARASAADIEITGDTALQGYDVASPWGDTILERRRFMQTLGLGAYHLQAASKPGEADYSFVLRVRLDADFGVNGHLSDQGETRFADSAGARFVPGFREAPVDLMYGYVEGRNLAGGWLGFRVGRQYVTDVLGFWSFDGGLVRVTTPFYVQTEVYGGFEQRGGLPLSTSRYEAQGVWRGSHSGYGEPDQPYATDYPSYQLAEPAPAFGVALESAGPTFVHGRFSYRRVYNTGTSLTQQLPSPDGGYRTANGLRLSQERLGYAADATWDDHGGAKAGFSYDLYSQLVATLYAGLEAHLGPRVTLGADFDYFEPTFDADSIWNWFSKSPVTTMTGRATVLVTRELDVSASGGARQWRADGDPDTFGDGECAAAQPTVDGCLDRGVVDPSGSKEIRDYTRSEKNRDTTTTTDLLANLAGRYRLRAAQVGLRGMVQAGERGRRAGADLSGEKRLDGGRYALGARVSLYDWEDPLRPDRDATSFGYVLGAGYRPVELARLGVEWEHDMNRLVGQRYRVIATLAFRVTP
jgi:hypothetical protein